MRLAGSDQQEEMPRGGGLRHTQVEGAEVFEWVFYHEVPGLMAGTDVDAVLLT